MMSCVEKSSDVIIFHYTDNMNAGVVVDLQKSLISFGETHILPCIKEFDRLDGC